MSSFFNKFLTKTHLADISVAVAHPNISTQTLLSITAARGDSVDGGSAARGAVVAGGGRAEGGRGTGELEASPRLPDRYEADKVRWGAALPTEQEDQRVK